MRFFFLFRGCLAAGVLLLAAPAAAQETTYLQERMAAGRAEYAAKRYAAAAEDFRIASFGFLDDPVHLSEALARLAVAYDAVGNAAGRDATLAKFVDLENRFAPYPNAPVETEIRASLERLLRAHVAASKLQQVPTLAGVARGEPTTPPPPSTAGVPSRPRPTPAPGPEAATTTAASTTVDARAVQTAATPVPTPLPVFPTAEAPAPAPTRTPLPVPPARTPVRPTEPPALPTVTSTPPPTRTPTPVPPTRTPVPPTPTPTPTPTRTPTSTPVPPTRTPTPTRVPPTRTSTPTAVPPTRTPLPPTATATPLPPTQTPSPVPPTRTPSPSRTPTPVPPTRTAVPPTRTRTSVPTRTAPPPTAIPPTAPPVPTRAVTPRVVSIESVDRPPRPLHTVQPVYPPDALRRRLRGLVVLRVLVSETGLPLEVRAVQGAPGGLTEAAERAVVQWTFEPALLGGRAVRTWATIRIPFEAIPFATPTPLESAEGESPAPIEDRTPTVVPPTRLPSRAPSATAAPPTPTPRPTPPAERRSFAAVPVPPEPPSGEPAPEARVYRTRRGVLFTLAPEQSRVFLDGRYIGIVDDWDGRGGGLVLEIPQRGPHRLRLELPGFRPFEAEIDVSATAPEQTIELGDDLERMSRSPYARLAKLLGSTRRYLALVIDPPDAQVSIDGGSPIPAGAVSSREPLDLSGSMGAHDITISSPGRALRTVRVIVAPNAPSEFATIRVALNPP